MFKNRDFNILVGISILILSILALGIYTSPTYTQREAIINSAMFFISVIFVASATLVVLWHGFKEFSLMLAIILAMIISLFGIIAGLIAVVFTYLIWGFAFSIELLLAHNGVQSAIVWFKKHYNVTSFKVEFKIFYPMILLMHIFLEIIPAIIYKEAILEFKPKELYKAMLGELENSNS